MNNASELIILIVYGILLVILLVFFAIAFAVIQKQRLNNYRMKLQEVQQKTESDLLKLKLEIQEQAYRAVSREVHDNIGQVLGSVVLIMETELSKNKEERNDQIFEASITRIRSTIDNSRNLCHRLNGQQVERMGLVPSIKRELAYLSLNSSLQTAFVHPPEEQMPRLGNTQTLILFRIVQEAIHNILRHANAGMLTIKIALNESTKMMEMEITDDGVGFDSSLASKGMGLLTMKERAKLLGGILEVKTAVQKGSTVLLSLKI
ncbi:histidine kinase [Niabella sp. CC-SYL272]|uniref:sensor histidine kinase n=1 Tax=Niabella agricola TaxID=2891571 RepID=UPI001F3752AD|nr:ATP-binding protein [Niabella agricola]MCF3109611.1 histidine kinase [Niabella agricola]